jgi:uncharacterized protein (DUF1778 family)
MAQTAQKTAQRTERAEARLRPDQKARIERAAQLKGLSVSDFMVQHAEEAAIRTIEQYETWTVTERDREAFIAALLNPPEPSPRLLTSIDLYNDWAAQRP